VSRWEPQELQVCGIDFRVREGRKFIGDLVIEWHTPQGGWRPITADVVFLLVDFLYDNEERRYPSTPDGRVLGGRKVLREVQHAAFHGWRSAVGQLQQERISKQRAVREARQAMGVIQ
jgi:hypothetical protein